MKNCTVIEGINIKCIPRETTATINYQVPEGSTFTFFNVNGIISYTDVDDNNAFQRVRIRVIRLTPELFIGSGTIVLIFGIGYRYRRPIKENVDKITKRVFGKT